jgi:hypothetical protein
LGLRTLDPLLGPPSESKSDQENDPTYGGGLAGLILIQKAFNFRLMRNSFISLYLISEFEIYIKIVKLKLDQVESIPIPSQF